MSIYDFDPGKPSKRIPPPPPTSARKTAPGRSVNPARRTPSASSTSQQARLKITVQRPDLLDVMSRKLGVSKAAVFNSALAELADRYGIK